MSRLPVSESVFDLTDSRPSSCPVSSCSCGDASLSSLACSSAVVLDVSVEVSESDASPSFGGVFRVVSDREVESSTASSYVSWSWCYGVIRVSWEVYERSRRHILVFNKGEGCAGKRRGEPFHCLYCLYARWPHRLWLPATRLPGPWGPPENRRSAETWLVGGGRLGADDAAGGRVE